MTRARSVTQILNLLMLAQALQEEILFWPRVEEGRDELCLRDVQPVAGVRQWEGAEGVVDSCKESRVKTILDRLHGLRDNTRGYENRGS